MARGIQEIDVFQAADALLTSGERPTIERVRQKIGRGSPNTVSPMLDLWFAQLGTRIRDPHAFSPSPSVPDPVQQAASHFWHASIAVAREECISAISEEKNALVNRELQLQASEAINQQRVQEIDRREADLDVGLQLAQNALTDAIAVANLAKADLRVSQGESQTLRLEVASVRDNEGALRAAHDEQRIGWESDRKHLEARGAAAERRAATEIDRAREQTRHTEALVADAERKRHILSNEVIRLQMQLDEASALGQQLAKNCNEFERLLSVANSNLAVSKADGEARLDVVREELAAEKRMRQNDEVQTELLRSLLAAFPKAKSKTTRRARSKVSV